MFYTYIIHSDKTGNYYIGCTNNLERRIQEHNANKTHSLKNRGPYRIIYTEQYLTKAEATKRELKIKSYKGGNGFRKLISGRSLPVKRLLAKEKTEGPIPFARSYST